MVVFVERPHAHVQHAGGYAHLDRVVIDIEKREAGIAAETDCSGACLHLCACALISPQPVAGGERAIDDGICPLILACGLQRHIALNETQPTRPIRWIGFVRRVRMSQGEGGKTEQEPRKEAPGEQRNRVHECLIRRSAGRTPETDARVTGIGFNCPAFVRARLQMPTVRRADTPEGAQRPTSVR